MSMADGGDLPQPPEPSKSGWLYKVAIFILVAVLVGAFRSAIEDGAGTASHWIGEHWPWAAAPASTRPADSPLSFAVPQEGEKVGKHTSVELGGAVPSGMHLWIFVHSPAGFFYGQGQASPIGINRWGLKQVAIGSDSTEDDDQYYQIDVVLADEHRDQEMEGKVKESRDDPVMRQLPGTSGAQSRTVFRDRKLASLG